MNIKIKKTKLFFLYFVGAVLLFALSVLVAPVWNNIDATWIFWREWGEKGAYLIIALLLTIYLFGFLFQRIKKHKDKSIYIPTIIEFTIVSVFTVMLIVNQIYPFMSKVVTGSIALGLVLYIHGLIDLIVLCFKHSESNKYEKIIFFIIDIILLSFGVWCIATDFIPHETLIWLFSLILFAIGIISIYVGIIAKPIRKKIKENKNA